MFGKFSGKGEGRLPDSKELEELFPALVWTFSNLIGEDDPNSNTLSTIGWYKKRVLQNLRPFVQEPNKKRLFNRMPSLIARWNQIRIFLIALNVGKRKKFMSDVTHVANYSSLFQYQDCP